MSTYELERDHDGDLHLLKDGERISHFRGPSSLADAQREIERLEAREVEWTLEVGAGSVFLMHFGSSVAEFTGPNRLLNATAELNERVSGKVSQSDSALADAERQLGHAVAMLAWWEHEKRVKLELVQTLHGQRGTHDFVSDYPETGMCDRLVERPNGTIEECREPVRSPIHDPFGYLDYGRQLRAELRTWRSVGD